MTAIQTRLYLITPVLFDRGKFAETLSAALDASEAACVRLRMPGASEDDLRRAVEALRPVCEARETALLMTEHHRLAAELEMDGVHFDRGANYQSEARDALGEDAVIGVDCGASRHQALTAGERGADYVSFGPVAQAPAMRAGDLAEHALFAWWQDMIELPVVAEGGMTPEHAARLSGVADFVAACRSVWDHPDGAKMGAAAYAQSLKREAAA